MAPPKGHPIIKFLCKCTSAKGPPLGWCMRGERGASERTGLSAHRLDQSGCSASQAGLQAASAGCSGGRRDGTTECPSRAIEPPPSHPHVLARRSPTRSNGPSASVPPFMMAADHESEGLGVRSSSVGYCAFPTEKATLKIGGWIWIDVWAYATHAFLLACSLCHTSTMRK